MIATGCVTASRAGFLEIALPGARGGCGVRIGSALARLTGTVCAMRGSEALVAVHGPLDGIAPGTPVVADEAALALPLGTCALGRAIDATGAALDAGIPIRGPRFRLDAPVPRPEERRDVVAPLWTGVKAIDALLTLGIGARVGIFGPPGAGKSTLLESIVRGAAADAIVVALVGERGREAERWIASCDRRTTVVCATSDRSAAERIRAANVAVAQAQALARRGLHVLLIVDSLARYASALREVAVAAGEPPGRGGYPPSVFSALAQLLERCGVTASGAISALATVLSDGDERDPVSEAARSLLDGHVALSPRLAHAGRFPAIDVTASASRTMSSVVAPAQMRDARRVRRALALLEEVADLRALGVVPEGAAVGAAIGAEAALDELLRQGADPVAPASTLMMLRELADTLGELHGHSN